MKSHGNRNNRSANVMANAKAAEARRSAIAEDFRARLTAELGPSDSVAREALIDAATSAYTEIKEISSLFLRCRAGDAAMSRLSLARSQLTRALRLLAPAASRSSDGSGGQPKGGIADYLAGRVPNEPEKTDA